MSRPAPFHWPPQKPVRWRRPPEDGNPGGDRPYWRRNLFRRFAADQAFLVRTWWPAEARRTGFSVPLALAVAGASGSTDPRGNIDFRSARSVERWTRGPGREIASGLTGLGENVSAAALLGGAWALSRATGNLRLERATSLSSEALMSTALYAAALKRLTRRSRPTAGGDGRFFVSHPRPGEQTSSFPSGHAAGVFAVATVFSEEYRDERWVPWVCYGTAGLVAASRVGLGRHFPSDVVAGAAIGHSVGRMVLHRSRSAGDPSPGAANGRVTPAWRLEPLWRPETGGIGVAYRRTW